MQANAVGDEEYLAIRSDKLGPEALRERFPTLANWRSCARDFGSSRAEQRALVQGLLVAGRLELALCAGVDGAPALFTHAGVTRRELELLGVEEAAPLRLAQALGEFFVGRIDAVRERWARGERAALDLSPLDRTSVVGAEAGGMLAHRPANPDRRDVDKPWEFCAERPRRLDPRHLPRGLTQVVGHTQHHKLKQELLPWVDPGTHAAAHGLRSVVVDDAVRYVPGVSIAGEGEAALVCTDFALHRAPGPDLELLEVGRVLS